MQSRLGLHLRVFFFAFCAPLMGEPGWYADVGKLYDSPAGDCNVRWMLRSSRDNGDIH